MSEKERIEVELLEELENERRISWKTFFNVMKLNAMYSENEWR